MTELDLPLSEEVAKESAKEIVKLKKKVTENKDVHISLLKDTLNDSRIQAKFQKKLSVVLCSIIIFCISAICFQYIYDISIKI